jgi:hypothetical protein
VSSSRARRRGPERAGYPDGLASLYMARGVRVPKSGPRSTTAAARSAVLHLDVAGRSTPVIVGPRLGTSPRGKGPRNPNRSASHDRDNASHEHNDVTPAAGRRRSVIYEKGTPILILTTAPQTIASTSHNKSNRSEQIT